MMKWEMGMDEIEAVLEKIWDLHDKLSDAIHAISRSHFLNTMKTLKKKPREEEIVGGEGRRHNLGFVFMKDIGIVDEDNAAAITEAKSLNAIRTALENLEDQLEFFHTVQSQQRAERDAAIARLEQSRIVLAMRLADHHGKNYRVIEEAQAFVGDVHDTGRFSSPENLFVSPRSQSGENLKDVERKSNTLMKVLLSSVTFAKRALKLEQMGGVLGNAALVAVSMVTLLHLHQVAFNKSNFVVEVPHMQENLFNVRRNTKNIPQEDGSSSGSGGFDRRLDVLEARG